MPSLEQAKRSEADSEHEQLEPDVARVDVDELRQERKKEERRLRVQHVDDDAVRVRPPERSLALRERIPPAVPGEGGAVTRGRSGRPHPRARTTSNATAERVINADSPTTAATVWTSEPVEMPTTERTPRDGRRSSSGRRCRRRPGLESRAMSGPQQERARRSRRKACAEPNRDVRGKRGARRANAAASVRSDARCEAPNTRGAAQAGQAPAS